MTAPPPQGSRADPPGAADYLAWAALATTVADGASDLTLREIPLLMLVEAVAMLGGEVRAMRASARILVRELAEIAGVAMDGRPLEQLATLAAAAADADPALRERAWAAFIQLRVTPALLELRHRAAVWNQWVGEARHANGMEAEPRGDESAAIVTSDHGSWADMGDVVLLRTEAPRSDISGTARTMVVIPKSTPLRALGPLLAHAAERWTVIAHDLQAAERGAHHGLRGL